ncbi:hypothetical protein EMCRGX_G004556 [Ephydatia muelleri]
MPSRNRKKRTKQRAEYLQKQEENKAKARERYKADPEKKKASVRESYKADPEKKKASVRESYIANIEPKRAAKRQRYGEDLEENRAAKRQRYGEDLEENRAVKRQRYQESVEENRAAKRRICRGNSATIKAARMSRYWKGRRTTTTTTTTTQSYSLFKPNSRTLAEYGVSLEKAILRDSELLSDVNNAFCNSHPLLAQKVVTRSARAAVTKVNPLQKLNDKPHEPWVAVEKRSGGSIVTAHCNSDLAASPRHPLPVLKKMVLFDAIHKVYPSASLFTVTPTYVNT